MNRTNDLKPHIGIFGRRNVGKSSFINKLAGQNIAIVSDIAGTTTDPVKKSFELIGFAPVVLIDTAGIDDTGELGIKRIEKTLKTIDIVDLAILIISSNNFGEFEEKLIKKFNECEVPFFIIHNKSDIEPLDEKLKQIITAKYKCEVIDFSNKIPQNFENIVEIIKNTIPESSYRNVSMLKGLIKQGDIVLLITPIDLEAPEGRMILPQVQAIRDILDNNCIAVVLKETEVETFLNNTKIKPALAITDSQVFSFANSVIPPDVPLTSFSIMLAHHKGDFKNYIDGTKKINELKDGDKVLILESCSHLISCDDIGRVKIPKWIKEYTGKNISFKVIAGLDKLPDNIDDYALVIQCGGCMITKKQLHNRLRPFILKDIAVSNYGMTIAYLKGIFNRAIEPFNKING
jgi:[FeFe] hydrogenase H-cluster maturation GTPase HydF